MHIVPIDLCRDGLSLWEAYVILDSIYFHIPTATSLPAPLTSSNVAPSFHTPLEAANRCTADSPSTATPFSAVTLSRLSSESKQIRELAISSQGTSR